ncbi:ankyrin repeat protein, putative [Trichomonas vaginalis G3]|uniref:Ankyrin repeat protein, putative n=1 Tax=Trichomonas vaginalis (strain ATCC PRA-98 / G3) TaxID=412133 RepID=A2E4W1_TRIV3|nr:proteasome regulatory particle assembly [Trichomonas vaginalis G3]EAY12300.1 ankyrin repeat protein, putative [Trichomonas vaginalis G3]KAI5552414.1 proteasome regulatory particle assembly [Trichomonas vaginalis G3]|eukprot:XP_001324523.1 ankyrin repeat protein [Trichomonas vaginalis G3]
MSRGIILNFEYIGAHIKDYINDNKFFDTFEIEDIETIMKYANLTPSDFDTLLKQSSLIIEAHEIYSCIRYASVSIGNLEDAISTLKSIRKYMQMKPLDGIIDMLNQTGRIVSDLTDKIEKLQTNFNQVQQEKENIAKEVQTLKSSIKGNDLPKEFLSKISELKNSTHFNQIYKFFAEISEKGNQKMMLKAIEEGLYEKKAEFGEKVLHYASSYGNLRLVKCLIECGCDKDAKNNNGWTPLYNASFKGELAVVQYLISVGANKEAKSNIGFTPLIEAAQEGKLAVVQYLISVGANKEAKSNDGSTPLIRASENGKLEVIQYLISVGANKEAKDNDGKTALSYAKGEVREYLLSIK